MRGYIKNNYSTIYCANQRKEALYMVFMKKIEKILKEKKMSKTDLQRVTGLNKRAIESIRYHDPSFSKMIKIADALDVSLDEFR